MGIPAYDDLSAVKVETVSHPGNWRITSFPDTTAPQTLGKTLLHVTLSMKGRADTGEADVGAVGAMPEIRKRWNTYNMPETSGPTQTGMEQSPNKHKHFHNCPRKATP